MRFYKKIPELGRILQRWRIAISDVKALNWALCAVFVGINGIIAGAAIALPLEWHTAAPILCAAILWNTLMAASISKQIAGDQTNISKNRVLFRRFQNTTKYLESMLQDTSDIILSLDQDSLIFKFNTGAQNHLGYSQEEILGKPFEMLFLNPEDKEMMFQLDKSGGVKAASAEVRMKTKSGQSIVANMALSRMRDGGFVVTAQDITERKYLEEKLKQTSERLNRLAITDDLTGLYNSRHFYVAIKSELTRLKRHPERKLSILYMDVDKFKEYNDTEGHLMGDSVLRSLGVVINHCIRKDVDAGFRYGGDEFVITLPDTDKYQANIAAGRILEQFSALKLGETGLSIGIAEATADDDEKTLVRKADAAMYVSKRKGGKQVTLDGDEP